MLSGASQDRPVIMRWSTLRRANWVHEGSSLYRDPVGELPGVMQQRDYH